MTENNVQYNSHRFCSTFHVFLPNHVVKQFGVVGVHSPTSWASNYLLLSVTAQVLSQFGTTFSGSLTI